MLPKRLLTILLASLISLAPVSASPNTALSHSLSQLGSIQSHLSLLTEALDSYNGGVWGLLTLANRVSNAQSAIRGARLNLDQLPVLSGDDFENWAGSYEELQPVILGALKTAHGKTDHFHKLGLKPVVAALVQGLIDERNGYKETIEGKMSRENITAMVAHNEEVDKTVKFVSWALGSV
ncbi:hypothetical protein SI65_07406 [Aspergillus cristatus]|uniref:Uncharacterized protein n=1 Tax=Aspergillus cristatus TaxID=573508 RepID=A0A1E3B7U5_ASPCR|nr:hypothetical protein SI65_07406 [Aspergillus cristatus]